MIIKPMQGNGISADELPRYCPDDDWFFEQKVDGHRLLVDIEDHVVTFFNKSGEPVSWAPALRKVFEARGGRIVFDGEWDPAKRIYWVFDLPIAGGHVRVTDPYRNRREVLEGMFRAWTDRPANVRLLPCARTPREKADLAGRLLAAGCEGVMVKRASASYCYTGKRTDDIKKAKFTNTVEVVITEVGRKGKASFAVGVYEPGNPEPVIVGAVTMIRGTSGLKVGDVIEVRYRHASPGDRRLVEPVFLRRRPDKKPAECTIDQLIYPCKEVLVGD